MKKGILLCCTVILLSAGCGTSERSQSAEKDQGREETKKLEGASAVGYDGKAVRKSVDNALNKNDDHNRNLDGTLKPDAEGQPKQ